MATCVGALSTEPCVSLKQCGKSRCGTVSPHGPGSNMYSTLLTMIRVSLSCKRLARLAFKVVRSIDGSDVENWILALNMT